MRCVSQRLRALFFVTVFAFGAAAVQAQNQTNVDQAKHMVDDHGVPQLSIDGVGKVAHPAWTALYALAYAGVEDYDPSLGLKADPQHFASTIDWLKANLVQDKNGLWVWPYNFDSTYNDVAIKAPWSSAFAQASGVQALVTHWKQTGDQSSLDAAKKAAESLFVPLSKGGFLFASGQDIWFEEIPASASNPSHILNGHMRALLALGELQDATGDALYQEWFTKGADTLLRWLPLYDAGYWIRYDLNPRKEELLFRLANPYGFANPEVAIDRIVLRDPVSGEESVLDVGSANDAEGDLRIAGNDWGQIEQVDGRSVRRLRPAAGEREAEGGSGQMVAPYSYFYLTLPSEWKDNLRKERFELSVEYLDEHRGNLEVQMRSIAPDSKTFQRVPDGELLLSGTGTWRAWNVPVKTRDLGYWVGTTYGRKHAEYLSKLSSRDKRFHTWAEVAKFYVNQLPTASYEKVTPQADKVPDQTLILPWYSLDAQGVLMMHVQDARSKLETGTAVYSPYIIASQAVDGQNMAALDLLLKKFNINKTSVKKDAALKWLLDSKNQFGAGGAVVCKFDFMNVYNDVVTPAPWQSSFGQTYVLKALFQSFKDQAADKKSLENLTESVMKAYSVDIADGGLAHSSKSGGLFFEEVPNRTHVLNAQLSALPVIHKVGEELKLPLGDDLFFKGVESLAENLSKFDTGYWLRYDLNPKKTLFFQFDWLAGTSSPLIESIDLKAPQFAKYVHLNVGSEDAFEGGSKIAGLEWGAVQSVDGRQVRAFTNGYEAHSEAVKGGSRQNVYFSMQLPVTKFNDYFDVQPHKLVIRYKDVSVGKFAIKIQSINEGNVLDFTPLRNAVLTTVGDQQWKTVVVEVFSRDMGWYKGSDYQVFEVQQMEQIAELTGDWFFKQYALRHRYFLDAKAKGQPVIVQPAYKSPLQPVELSVIQVSPTYDGFGFENALDGDPNDDYVASIENTSLEYVDVRLDKPVLAGVLKFRWESRANYAQRVRVFALDAAGEVTQEIASAEFKDGEDAELQLKASNQFQSLRIEFSSFVGQPRLLVRLITLNASLLGKDEKAEAARHSLSKNSKGNFLDAKDPRNPLNVFRIPVTLEVKALSDELVHDVIDDHQKILAFMKYIDGFAVGVASSSAPDETIMEQEGACGSFTNTLLAFAAAQGFEGRVISLLNYPKNDGHAVAEIRLKDKWALYDPTYNAFYTLAGSDVPLSFYEIKESYEKGVAVVVHHESKRDGVNDYAGRNIFTKANPLGVIGPGKPFLFPLKFTLPDRHSLEASEFGAKWQGANFIGAAPTNQQQEWTLDGLKKGANYTFEITAKNLGGDLDLKDLTFNLRSVINRSDGTEKELLHKFNFADGKPQSWKISFVASGATQKISLKHDYAGPQYLYMNMQSYKLYKN
ncbi:D-glucuronyl C5-epimerase family protein [Pseudomonas anguilliseptica]|uniref:D-glucuronyl C5-epimerase C-terminus n=1 Tax=Pseudomonas anguilliseptica TaxID=53406 RepID=A0A1H4QMI1_PSEAG|nr:D-glucuronyl C5-epimerase family protein [Pseudomonas anguilliseptica]SEC20711.1 D-glucuronyl C5-epimerase C-terminus [Pseudomonas anguilliseptica]